MNRIDHSRKFAGVAILLFAACNAQMLVEEEPADEPWAGNAADCPTTPVEGTVCTVAEGQACALNVEDPSNAGYHNRALCGCFEASSSERRWYCYMGESGPGECPATEPSNGESCFGNYGASCAYPERTNCTCSESSGGWSCEEQGRDDLTAPPTSVPEGKAITALSDDERAEWCDWYTTTFNGPGYPEPADSVVELEGVHREHGLRLRRAVSVRRNGAARLERLLRSEPQAHVVRRAHRRAQRLPDHRHGQLLAVAARMRALSRTARLQRNHRRQPRWHVRRHGCGRYGHGRHGRQRAWRDDGRNQWRAERRSATLAASAFGKRSTDASRAYRIRAREGERARAWKRARVRKWARSTSRPLHSRESPCRPRSRTEGLNLSGRAKAVRAVRKEDTAAGVALRARRAVWPAARVLGVLRLDARAAAAVVRGRAGAGSAGLGATLAGVRACVELRADEHAGVVENPCSSRSRSRRRSCSPARLAGQHGRAIRERRDTHVSLELARGERAATEDTIGATIADAAAIRGARNQDGARGSNIHPVGTAFMNVALRAVAVTETPQEISACSGRSDATFAPCPGTGARPSRVSSSRFATGRRVEPAKRENYVSSSCAPILGT